MTLKTKKKRKSSSIANNYYMGDILLTKRGREKTDLPEKREKRQKM
jgi:hypothetical protein